MELQKPSTSSKVESDVEMPRRTSQTLEELTKITKELSSGESTPALAAASAEKLGSTSIKEKTSVSSPSDKTFQTCVPKTSEETAKPGDIVDNPEAAGPSKRSSEPSYSREQRARHIEQILSPKPPVDVSHPEVLDIIPPEKPYIQIPSLRHIQVSRDYVFKVIVIGDANVGKTSIINHYVDGFFVGNYKATVGVDFFDKVEDTQFGYVRLRIHDVAGQDRNASLSRSFYMKSNGVLICYDCTSQHSLLSVKNWITSIDDVTRKDDGSVLPRILVGNKCDIKVSQLHERKDIVEFARANKFCAWFEASAKTGYNIKAIFEALIDAMILQCNKLPKEMEDPEIVSLDEETPKKSKCASMKCS